MKKTILIIAGVICFYAGIFGQIPNDTIIKDVYKKNYKYALDLYSFTFDEYHQDYITSASFFYIEVYGKNGQKVTALELFKECSSSACASEETRLRTRYRSPRTNSIGLYFFEGNDLSKLRIYGLMKDGTNTGLFETSRMEAWLQDKQITSFSLCTNGYAHDSSVSRDRQASISYDLYYSYLPLHWLNVDTINGAPNIYLPAQEKINIFDKAGFTADQYRYQYRIVNGSPDWIDISSSLFNLHTLSLSAQDLFGNDYASHIGERIQFRAVSCYNSQIPDGFNSVSNIIDLKVIPSAPHITNSVVLETLCFDTTDGTVRLDFDRALYTGETLRLLLSNNGNPTNISVDTLSAAGENLSLELYNLAAGTYTLNMQGEYANDITYTDGASHTLTFTITNPTAVSFSTSKTDVNCFEGADGSITLTANGGNGGYSYTLDNGATWTAFSGANATTISNLTAGSYLLKVKDRNDCVAKIGGSEKTETVIINQPASAIAFTEIEIKDPTGYGLTNGWISVRVIGGTPNDDNSYAYQWRKESPTGAVITSNITTDAVNNPFTILLNNIGKGTYYLTVKDKNYANATSNLDSCGIISYVFTVNQPDSLVASISLEKCISCNIANQYEYKSDSNGNNVPDEAEDAIVKVTVKGGIVGTYTYQWQKLNGSTFENIPNATDTLLAGLTEGTYKVLVKDRNNNTDNAALFVPFPAQLKITLSATDVKCNEGNAGEVSVTAAGGRGDYTYQWNTMDTSPTVSGLAAGRYFVFVRDSANCAVKGSIEVKQPSEMEIADIAVENPLCTGAANGKISVKATGGKQPYSLKWSNGMTGENITGLTAGTYTLTFTDSNQCTMYVDYVLTDPAPFSIDLGGDITLCVGDSMVYDMTVADAGAKYQWKKANSVVSNAPVFTIKDAGVYTLTVTTSNGCAATDDVKISQSDEVLTPEFMLTTYAYTLEKVILVNVSPEPPERVEWVIPDDNSIQVISETPEFLELIFTQEGSYVFGLRGYQGECVKTFSKPVVVEDNIYGISEKLDSLSNIVKFYIAPNPNRGQFTVTVELREAAPIMLRVVNIVHQAYPAVNKPAAPYFSVPFDYALALGIYLVILQTGQEMRTAKMIVK